MPQRYLGRHTMSSAPREDEPTAGKRAERLVSIISLVIAAVAVLLSYRATHLADQANRIARQQSRSQTVVLDTTRDWSQDEGGTVQCLYRVRLANLGAAPSSLVSFTAAISYNGATAEFNSEANFASIPFVFPVGPNHFVVSLADLSRVTVRTDIESEVLSNGIREPVNLEGRNARDIWVVFVYSYDTTKYTVDSLFGYYGEELPPGPGLYPISLSLRFNFADDTTAATRTVNCWALQSR